MPLKLYYISGTKQSKMKFKYDGERLIKAVRTKRLVELNIDMRQAAKKIGTSAATLSRIENGKTPDVETLASLCHWTGTNMNDCVTPLQKISSKIKSSKQLKPKQ